MATLNEVDIQLRAQGEREATAALKRFRDESKRLSTSVIDSGRKIESINSRWKEAERLQQKNVISAKALRAAQTQLAREYAVLNGMTETYVRNGQQYTRVATNQAKTTLLNKAATEQAAAAQAQYAQRMEQLRLRLDPVYRASQQYKQSLRELIQFQKAGGITMDEYRQRVVQLKDEFGKVSQGGRGARRSMNNFNVAIQQAGFQVSDFAIQVQSGQSAFVAFSQQASQLVGILPLVAENIGLTAGRAIALSAGLGVAIPLITVAAGVLFNLSEGAEESATEIDRIDEELKKFIKTKEAFSRGITLDQLFATDELSRVERELETIREVYQSLSAESVGRSLLGAIPGSSYLGLDDMEKLASLREAEEEALERISSLEEKIAHERQKQYKEEELNLEQEIALQRMSLQFGEESTAVSRLKNQQERTNLEIKLREKDFTDTQISRMLDLLSVHQSLTEELEESSDNTDKLAVGMDRVSQAAQNAANSVMSISSGIRSALFEVQMLEAGNAAAQRVISRGGSEIEARSVQKGVQVEERMRAAGSGEREILAASSAAVAAERRRLTAIEERRALFSKFTPGSAGGGGAGRADTQDYLAGLEQEAKFKRSLIGLSDEQIKTAERRQSIVEKLTQDGENLTETESKRVEELLRMEAQTRRLTEAEEQRQAMMDRVEGHMKNALISVVDGSKSVEDAFRTMMRNIILSVYETKVAEPAANAFGNLVEAGISSLFTNAKGNVISGGEHVTAYADGGVVNRATMFPMRGGMGLMGEAGPEAIMPLKRGSNGKLGVQMDGAAGGVTVVQNFNISANGDESVKRIVRQESPRIAEQAKSAVVDAKRRGGTYGRSF